MMCASSLLLAIVAWASGAEAGLLYRRGSVPGARTQLQLVEEPSLQDAYDGWQNAELQPHLPLLGSPCTDLAVAEAPGPAMPISEGRLVVHGASQPTSVRKRPASRSWNDFAAQTIDDPAIELRYLAKEFLAQRKLQYRSLVPNTHEGGSAVIAHCGSCAEGTGCSTAWNFYVSEKDNKLVVQRSGVCSVQKNIPRLKRHWAQKYAAVGSPGRALQKMRDDGISEDEWPTDRQLEAARNYLKRQQNKGKAPLYPAICIGAFQLFLAHAPDHVQLLQTAEFPLVARKDKVLVAFGAPSALELARRSPMKTFLMDFTFKSNCHDLVLGCIGPVGLTGDGDLPHMRMIPAIFVLAREEDHEARRQCMELFFDIVGGRSLYEDAFMDFNCLQSAEKVCGQTVYLHRCLQHTKTDIEKAAHEKEKNGLTRLLRMEMLPLIKEWVVFSSTLPTDVELRP
ncbi:unnamed protein product [Prorocentrum cordatum]|uniref:MULE transposase domain-containing protein n=1 Tax=Prorocentrum cordatum TaxID=2364126 RepID=A0ABN9QQP9_9DINO|nr:unnamed protein product [Polarella glacialis]